MKGRQKGIMRQLQLAFALFVLIFALLKALSVNTPNLPMDIIQLTNWKYNYSLGLLQRGFMGSIFQFFHGAPDNEKIYAIIPVWEYYLLIALIVAVWGLSMGRLLLLKLDSNKKWFLLCAASVLLLAPIWGTAGGTGGRAGFMDKYIFAAALLMLVAVVNNRPWLYLPPCLCGFLIHPQMIFYALLFIMLIIHALCFFEHYQKKYRQWIAAGVLPLCFSLLLYFLADPQNNVDLLIKYNYTDNKELFESFTINVTQPDTLSRDVSALWSIFPGNIALGLLVFSGLPLLWAAITAYGLGKSGIVFKSNIFKPYVQKYIFVQVVEKYHLFAFLMLATVFIIAINIVSVDWSRHLYVGWWGGGIAFIYLLWNIPRIDENPELESYELKKRTGVNRLKVILLLLAYMYGGAPLNVSHINRPWIFACRQFCIPMLTINPLGEFYSFRVFSSLEKALFPAYAAAGDIKNHSYKTYNALDYKDDKLVVPKDFQGYIFAMDFPADAGGYMQITAEYEASAAPALNLRVNNHLLEIASQDKAKTVWGFSIPRFGLYNIELRTEGGSDFKLIGVSMKKI